MRSIAFESGELGIGLGGGGLLASVTYAGSELL